MFMNNTGSCGRQNISNVRVSGNGNVTVHVNEPAVTGGGRILTAGSQGMEATNAMGSAMGHAASTAGAGAGAPDVVPKPVMKANGLAVVPSGLFPLYCRHITDDHLKGHFQYYPVFDPEGNDVFMSPETLAVFTERVKVVHGMITAEAKKLVKQKIIENFQAEGLGIGRQGIFCFNHVGLIIKSEAMKTEFEKNPMTPFALIMKLVHRTGTPTETEKWLHPAIQKWCRESIPGAPEKPSFEIEAKKHEYLHSVIQIASKGAGSVYEQIQRWQSEAFGMSLRVKATHEKTCQTRSLHQVSITFDRNVNPNGIKTYLLIDKGRHPRIKDNPVQNDLVLATGNDHSYHAFMMALAAHRSQMTKEAAHQCLNKALDEAYEVADSNLVLPTLPKVFEFSFGNCNMGDGGGNQAYGVQNSIQQQNQFGGYNMGNGGGNQAHGVLKSVQQQNQFGGYKMGNGGGNQAHGVPKSVQQPSGDRRGDGDSLLDLAEFGDEIGNRGDGIRSVSSSLSPSISCLSSPSPRSTSPPVHLGTVFVPLSNNSPSQTTGNGNPEPKGRESGTTRTRKVSMSPSKTANGEPEAYEMQLNFFKGMSSTSGKCESHETGESKSSAPGKGESPVDKSSADKSSARVSEENKDVEEQYLVEKVLEVKKKNGRYEFLVKWVGYPEPTWEPRKHLVGEELCELQHRVLLDH